MFKYLRYFDIALRICLNPFNWEWKLFFTHDKPTPFFPKRNTYGFGWLFLQVFVDVDDGTRDFKAFNDAFINSLDMEIEEDVQVG